MEKNLYIDASHPDEIRVVLKSKNYIEEYEYENKNKLYLKNNIYLGKVSRIDLLCRLLLLTMENKGMVF